MSTIETEHLPTVDEVVKASHTPHIPIYCIRPNTLKATAANFVSIFKPGAVLFAVKCNMEPEMLKAIWEGGVKHFDCASIRECETIRTLFGPTAGIHYLNPVKAPEDIREAYTKYGVKTFVLDTTAELEKILSIVRQDDDEVTLLVRLAIPGPSDSEESGEDQTDVHYSLSGKFGVESVEDAAAILQSARSRIKHVGISFHVGSQCTDPRVYARALEHTRVVLEAANVPIDIVDVGGGYPVRYQSDLTFPSIEKYVETIRDGYEKIPKTLTQNATLWCEPGRALVGAGGSLVIRVEDRRLKGEQWVLYVNDGIYGHFQDALPLAAWPFPVRLIRQSSAPMIEFSLFGPTFDSMDYMPGPFLLPSDVKVGDHIEVGQLGAYSTCFRTLYNGFSRVVTELVCDEAMLTKAEDVDTSN